MIKLEIEIKQEFPCGYKLEIRAQSIRGVDPAGFKLGVCPIHGLKCKKHC